MSEKSKRIISVALMAISSAMLVFSAIMKLTGSEQMVAGLTHAGLGNYIQLIGITEILAVVLFLFPKTFKVGFLLVTSYLGGALSIELAAGQPPMAAMFLIIVWVSAYLRNKYLFVSRSANTELA